MTDQRTHTRFPISRPIVVFSPPGEHCLATGVTENISSTGVRFRTDVPLRVGEHVVYVVALNLEEECERSVDLRCTGKIVRTEELVGTPCARYAVAVKRLGYSCFVPKGTSA